MKPLIVGEAPSKNEDTPRPIEGRIGKRLAKLSGLTLEGFLSTFERMNLLQVRQDSAEHGFTFDMVAARAAAEASFQHDVVPGRIVLLLGQRVARAYGVRTDYFEECSLRGARAYVVPHPSGVSHWWNDATHMVRAEGFMHGIVDEQKGTR